VVRTVFTMWCSAYIFYDTYVLTYGDEIYLLSGAYLEEEDEYHQNISDVISTITFRN